MNKMLCTMPGMLGDNFFKIPVAYQLTKYRGTNTDIVVDEGSRCLIGLLEKQSWVDNVFTSPGIRDYSQGGQPFDFGRHEEFNNFYESVYHLGFPSFPHHNLTFDVNTMWGYNLDYEKLKNERPIKLELKPPTSIAIHCDASDDGRFNESYLSILGIKDYLKVLGKDIFVISNTRKEDFYRELFDLDNVHFFNDGGDLNKTAELLSHSVLIATWSSMWAFMAACIKGPQVVIMDNPGGRITDPNLEKVAPPFTPGVLAQTVLGHFGKITVT